MGGVHSKSTGSPKWKGILFRKRKPKSASAPEESGKPSKEEADSVTVKGSQEEKVDDKSPISEAEDKDESVLDPVIVPFAPPGLIESPGQEEENIERMADLIDLDDKLEKMALGLESDTKSRVGTCGQVSSFPFEEWEVATLNVSAN
jgi:hypothetical protein